MTAIHPNKANFSGPVFLVGMPRSGTKLLRQLLNEHPDISIPNYETEFFPYWVKRWQSYGNLSDFSTFMFFYHSMLKIPYFLYHVAGGTVIDVKTWFHACKDYTPAIVFEALIRHDTNAPEQSSIIWGDKSPTYLNCLVLLKRHFPTARFIHIVRDVRDYSLSMHQAWGMNMLLAAQRWTDSVAKAHSNMPLLANDYFVLRYEDLLTHPRGELNRICTFLGISFRDEMLSLSVIPENIGDTKGTRNIVKNNMEKYKKRMDPDLRSRIEGIANDSLKLFGYPVSYNGPTIRISKEREVLYRLLDYVNQRIITVRRRGLIEAYKLYSGFGKIRT